MLIQYALGPLGKAKQFLYKKTNMGAGLSFDKKVGFGLIERPHYAYCAYHAAELAARLGHKKVAVCEFGVAGGNGLVTLEKICTQIEESGVFPVEFEIYGFDTGEGMPEVRGAVDLPYWFKQGQYKMDVPALKKRLTRSELVIGDVNKTIPEFAASKEHAPIGAMMIDVDYYSSTRDCLNLLEVEGAVEKFLPRVHIYLDDIIGSAIEMYGPYNGMILAVNEFNERNSDAKIHLNQNLLPFAHLSFRQQIYFAHLFGHPEYNTYVGANLQTAMEEKLKLRAS